MARIDRLEHDFLRRRVRTPQQELGLAQHLGRAERAERMHAPVERRRAHRGEQAARAAFEFVERRHRIERRNLLAVAQQLRVHAAHGSAHADHRIERVQPRAGEAAAGRLALERAPAAGHAVRVLVAVVALDVQHAAEAPVADEPSQRDHRRPEAPVLPDR